MIDFALLAPIPLEHLESGRAIAEATGFVAFGSRKWEMFRKLDNDRNGKAVPVLIYPSHNAEGGQMPVKCNWLGWYIGHVESPNGKHPEGGLHRPTSTESDTIGHWAIFWHMAHLKPVETGEQVKIQDIQTISGGWRKNSPPRGPELIATPPGLIYPVSL